MKRSEFRIETYNGWNTIQRLKETKVTTGCLWWRKTTITKEWLEVTDTGEYCYMNVYGTNMHRKIPSYKSITEAMNMIETIVKGPEIIYLTNKNHV